MKKKISIFTFILLFTLVLNGCVTSTEKKQQAQTKKDTIIVDNKAQTYNAQTTKDIKAEEPAKQNPGEGEVGPPPGLRYIVGEIQNVSGQTATVNFGGKPVTFKFDGNTNYNKLLVDHNGSAADIKTGLAVRVLLRGDYATKIEYYNEVPPGPDSAGRHTYIGLIKNINDKNVILLMAYNREYTFKADISPDNPILVNGINETTLSVQLKSPNIPAVPRSSVRTKGAPVAPVPMGTWNDVKVGQYVSVITYNDRAIYIGIK